MYWVVLLLLKDISDYLNLADLQGIFFQLDGTPSNITRNVDNLLYKTNITERIHFVAASVTGHYPNEFLLLVFLERQIFKNH